MSDDEISELRKLAGELADFIREIEHKPGCKYELNGHFYCRCGKSELIAWAEEAIK